MVRRAILVLLVAGCPRQPVVYQPVGAPPAEAAAEEPRPSTPDEPCPSPPVTRPSVPGRSDFKVGKMPMSIVVVGGTLAWTDSVGTIWSMPADGRAPPKKLSDQRSPGYAAQLFTAGDRVFATTRGDLLRVELPDGPVTKARITGLPVLPEESVADASHIYLTLFQRNDIVRVPAGGGAAKKVTELAQGVLALRGDTLFAISYPTGVLVELPAAGGKVRRIARGLPRPTAIAVDERSAYIYCEGDESLHRVDLATGADSILARELVNSDEVHLDGPYVYTRSWGTSHALVRVPRDGSRPAQVVADGLASPYQIAMDGEAIYITSRDADTIVRLAKSSLPP